MLVEFDLRNHLKKEMWHVEFDDHAQQFYQGQHPGISSTGV